MTSGSPAASALQIPQIDAAAASRALQAGQAVIIDVREPDEHAREHIASARLLPLTSFSAASLPADSSRTLVLHCKAGTRSAEACRLALAAGRTNVRSLTGGIEAWKQAGFPVVSAGGGASISVLRQVQIVVGLGVLAGAALGAFVSPWWLILPAFFGAGLTVAGATGTCGLAAVLSRMPWNRVHPSAPGSLS